MSRHLVIEMAAPGATHPRLACGKSPALLMELGDGWSSVVGKTDCPECLAHPDVPDLRSGAKVLERAPAAPLPAPESPAPAPMDPDSVVQLEAE